MEPHPTPYCDVNEVLNLLLAEARDVLGKQFVGLYLYGSLASGDFEPDSSDIDFLVVTVAMPDGRTIADLECMHRRIWETGLSRSEHALEHVTIVSKQAAARWARQEFDGRRQKAIDQALAVQAGHGGRDLTDEAVAFIRLALERASATEHLR